jgi:hypothetical protein
VFQLYADCVISNAALGTGAQQLACINGTELYAGDVCNVTCATGYTARAGTTTQYECTASELVKPTVICDRMRSATCVRAVVTAPGFFS